MITNEPRALSKTIKLRDWTWSTTKQQPVISECGWDAWVVAIGKVADMIGDRNNIKECICTYICLYYCEYMLLIDAESNMLSYDYVLHTCIAALSLGNLCIFRGVSGHSRAAPGHKLCLEPHYGFTNFQAAFLFLDSKFGIFCCRAGKPHAQQSDVICAFV